MQHPRKDSAKIRFMIKSGPRFTALCVAGVGLLLCLLALLWPEPEENRPFTLAVGVWPGMETLTLAREEGGFLDSRFNFVELSWTSATMMAFENRVVDGAMMTLDEMLRLKSNGHSVNAVLVLGKSKGGDAIIARPGIKTLEDIKNKRVGVELRASGEYFLSQALKHAGLKTSDVTMVPLNLAEAENAFEQMELDILVTTDPVRERLIQKGAHLLIDSAQIDSDIYRVLVVRQDLARERQKELFSLIQIHFAALPSLHAAHNEKAMSALLRRERLSQPEFSRSLNRISDYDRDANIRLLTPGPNGLEPILQRVNVFMKAEGLLDEELNLEGLLDASFVKGGE